MSPRHLILLILAAVTVTVTQSTEEEAPLGRLFMDSQQRARLDAQRRHNPGFQANAADSEASQTLSGEVRSSNGRRTSWINGEAHWESTTPAPRVPVGDTFNPATGERESLIGNGRIEIRRNTTSR
ncbi:MAG: hypothetical protein H6R14_1063 [Proteobacteria bacterium]|nr:hypothetical protein [Pseudomonadota bacterium]